MIYFAVVPDTMPEHRLLAVEPNLGLLYWLELPIWERTEVHLLRAIGLAGHRRAAIDQVVDYGKLMICWFVDCSWKPTSKSSIDWHVASLPRQQCKPHERISSRITFTPGDGDAHCILRHPIPLSDIFSLFGTSDCLLTDVECLQLPAECKEAITSCTTATRPFDRIRVYTDGSSHPSQKHWHPDLVMQEGLADSWAFTVIGEYYGSSGKEDTSSFVFLGYQTHPITYNVEAPYYVGADHVGSDISEREALFWAALWRLAYDSNVPTVFLTDSSTSANFVSGNCGTTTAKPGMHHRLTRGIFQALEAALPGDSLQITHIPGHCGEVWNEFCDVAAKFSSTTTHWKPRQQVDMQKWRHLIPHLWMYFSAEVHGLPNFNQQGFLVTPPHQNLQSNRIAPKNLAQHGRRYNFRSAWSQPMCELCKANSTIYVPSLLTAEPSLLDYRRQGATPSSLSVMATSAYPVVMKEDTMGLNFGWPRRHPMLTLEGDHNTLRRDT